MRISLNHRPNCWIRIQKEETNYRIRPIAALLYDRIPPLKKLGLFLTAVYVLLRLLSTEFFFLNMWMVHGKITHAKRWIGWNAAYY